MANDDLIRGGTATVAANGTQVTGQGVSWSNVREGDFFGAHRGLAVPIAAIAGSVITLAYPWPGAAQTAAAYAIQPKGDVTRFQDRVRQLIEMLSDGELAAIAALTPGANTVPYFTGSGAAALANFPSVARDFLNRDFMPVQQGGGAGQGTNKVQIGWDGSDKLKAQVDALDLGMIWTDIKAGFLSFATGYQRLPSGLIFQWGYVDAATVPDVPVTFPIAFPNAFRHAVASPFGYPGLRNAAFLVAIDGPSKTTMAIRRTMIGPSGALNFAANPSFNVSWLAWGV